MLVTPCWVKEGGKVNSPWSWQLLLSKITPLCLGVMRIIITIIIITIVDDDDDDNNDDDDNDDDEARYKV